MQIYGIDPGSTKSGVAELIDGSYRRLLHITFHELMILVDESEWDAQFYVEDPKSMRVAHRNLINEKEAAIARNMAHKVGQCAAAAKLIIEGIEFRQRKVFTVKPQRGISKRTKKDMKFFNQLTGWTKNSNEHKRDAAMLIYKFHRKN